MCQNNKFSINRFKKRVNRFSNPTFVEEEYKWFDFDDNLKSFSGTIFYKFFK